MKVAAALGAAAGVWLLGTLATALIPVLVPLEMLQDDIGEYVWFALPHAVITALMALAAGLVHGRDELRSVGGAVVVLALPAIHTVAGAVLGAVVGTEAAMNVAQAVCSVAGALLVYLLMRPARAPMRLASR
ncbi:hypothetical protein [Nocardiopsis halophila]|uniref:hypothetical protein n=1 Tax=Nocardiopsis halophila TaxID=141692 RepID=UPI00034999C5|nr:hypothetical protein [Nocardiopsis halophila]